jgi:hypothetical protein
MNSLQKREGSNLDLIFNWSSQNHIWPTESVAE